MTIRILIADDHGVLRAGLRALLKAEPDLKVVGEVGNGDEVLPLASRLRPDVVLLDISLPGPDGIEVTRRLKAALPDTQMLILSMHEDSGIVREALRAGAAGYVIKRAVESEVIAAIRAVYRGELYVHPALTRALLEDLSPAPTAARKADALTVREIDILRLIAEGHTNRQIAQALSLSVRTVESHRATIMDKLGLHNRAELARYAAEHGLLRSGKGNQDIP